MSGSDIINRYPKRRYIVNGKQELDDNNAKNVTQIITYMPDILEHTETSKLESSFVEVKVKIRTNHSLKGSFGKLQIKFSPG
jgi:hypothetical protein